ncbi:glycosyltransferase family 4 protein [Sphingomonas crocodyli]|uniref:Colanic acid biosynthesis glycosyltransferase WcaL n=1 Tax=Sphingomonas crocodyli TaxID=1979270 RepID=A0A437M458_9SPHN|nr:glycosyltransferase family 4 protein [Sphingomonas crocodyli]RVT92491.1 colanic acid biosynthesis glycosyltransferase WcaL [Sphingomonas crocodyli]
MRLAYLLNSYPMTSTTFIRREIEAIERAGVPVKRFAVRHWSETLVDPADIAEQARTEYLLTRNVGMLLLGAACALLTRPGKLVATWPAWRSMHCASDGGLVRHIGYLLQAIHLQHRCAQLGITHIHAHFSTNAAGVAMLCRLLGGPPYSFTVHGPDELVDPAANAIAVKAQHARNIMAISAYCRTRLHDALPPELHDRIAIIPCGIEPRAYADMPPPSGGDLLCVGRLCPQKGQIEIPAVVAALADRFPDLRVLLVGDGESRADIEAAIAQHKIPDRVRLLGWRTNDEVRALLGSCRALLLPSHAEGLPVVIMEALASGRPVISTTIAGIPELVDEGCGWLYPAGSADGLLAAITAAFETNTSQLAQMGEEGARRVAQNHDIDAITPQLLALFAD